jgi:membrane protease YdiL (CAAX protease family)
VTAGPRCSACGRGNAEIARFCRHCGASIDPALADAEAHGAAPNVSAPASVSPFDDQRLFRELCWLCGLPLMVSVLFTVQARIWGLSATAATLASLAMASISLVGGAYNATLVRQVLRVPKLRYLGEALLVALVVGPSLTLAFWLLQQLGFTLFSDYLAPYQLDGWPTWVGFADVALLTPITEELLYRGLVQPKLEQIVSPTEALIVQAALFSAAHLSPVILVTHFGMGLALGWVRRRSGSLLPGILLHAAWNAWVIGSGG